MAVIDRFLERRRPGWLLERIARAPVPIAFAERIAARRPGPAVHAVGDPLACACPPRPAVAGVLDGDVVIKDQIDVAGCPTGMGLGDPGAPAARDATVVARIAAAGGRIVGKAKMTELGVDGLGVVMGYGVPDNPRAPGYAPGGSSTGTAVAVAAGLARYGVGGDGLGSIRIPAAFCGLVGLKPSRDRLPRDGVHSPVRTLDAIGPIARTAEDCARLWQVMAGDPVAPLPAWLPPRIAVPAERPRAARVVERAVARVLAALGVPVERVPLPGIANVTFLGGMFGAYELATGPWADRVHLPLCRTSRAMGRALSPENMVGLTAQRDALAAALGRVLDVAPILALPTSAFPPPAITRARRTAGPELVLMRGLGAFTPLANLADVPAIAVPCGVDDRGRPLSIMFVAAAGGEERLLALAAAVEATGLATHQI